MLFWTLHDPPLALREWRRVLAPGGSLVVIDALHFAAATTLSQRVRRLRERSFWAVHDQLDQARDRLHRRPTDQAGRYRTDSDKPPGMTWQSFADAQRPFADAGLKEVAPAWLDEVADADRRTVPLRWRLAGRLPRFFTLTWQKLSADDAVAAISTPTNACR